MVINYNYFRFIPYQGMETTINNTMKRILSIVATLVAWEGFIWSQDIELIAGSMDLNNLEGQRVEVVDSFYYRLDSVYTYVSTGGQWVLDSKSSYKYDAYNNIQDYLFQFYEGGLWKNGKRVIYSYAQNNTVLQTQTMKWNSQKSDWEFVWQKSYQQDVNSTMLVVMYSEWENTPGRWVDKWQQVQNYNQDGKLTGYNTRNWIQDENRWVDYWNYNCLYDENGNLLELTNKSFDVSQNKWDDEWDIIYEYDASGKLYQHQIIDWNKEDQAWNNVRSFSVSYPEGSEEIVEIRKDWNIEKDDWDLSVRHSQVLDDEGRVANDVYEKWNDTYASWENNRKDTYAYNEDGIKVEEATFYWDKSLNDYKNHLKSVYYYSVIAIDKPIDPEYPNGDFYLYPNPAVDYVYISNLYEESVLTIYTSDGQAVMQKKIVNANAPVNVSGLAKGVYIATLKSESGIKTTKFLKK